MQIQEIRTEHTWETFVLSNGPMALFQSWVWGEVQKNQGFIVNRFGIFDGTNLLGVFQTVLVRAKRGSFLHVRHGPILKEYSEKIFKTVLKHLAEIAKQQGCWFVRVSPLIEYSNELQTLYKKLVLIPAAIHRMDGEQVWVLDLGIDEEQLLANMRKTTRYEIHKAQKEHVEVVTSSDIGAFMNLYKKTSMRHGFVGHMGIEDEFDLFTKAHKAVLYIGKHNGIETAGALIIYYGNQAIYHHGASVPSRWPVSTLVQWKAIRDAKKNGMRLYNFWGIAPQANAHHPWAGITLFKKGFGGRERSYMHAHDLAISPFYVIPRSLELIRKRLKGYD